MWFSRLLAWPTWPFFPSLNTDGHPGSLQRIAPSSKVSVVVKPCLAVGVMEDEMVVADGDVVRRDKRLGEQSPGASSTVASTMLTLLITNAETASKDWEITWRSRPCYNHHRRKAVRVSYVPEMSPQGCCLVPQVRAELV